MKLMGIGDEAANKIDGQIQATRELGWRAVEMRNVEVPGFPKANFHDIPDAAFDNAAKKLEAGGIGVYCFGSTVMNWAKKSKTRLKSRSRKSSAPSRECSGSTPNTSAS